MFRQHSGVFRSTKDVRISKKQILKRLEISAEKFVAKKIINNVHLQEFLRKNSKQRKSIHI